MWSEIQVGGCIAPPLAFHSMICVSEQFLLSYGGLSANNSIPTDGIFKFDTRTKTWSVMKLLSNDQDRNTDSNIAISKSTVTTVIPPLHNHSLLKISNDRAVLLGGLTNDVENPIFSRIVSLDNILDEGKEPMLNKYLINIKKDHTLCDIVLKARSISDSIDYIGEIHAHKAILSSRCTHLSNLINQNENQDEFGRINEIMEIYIEDCDLDTLEAFIDFLYCGNINLQGEESVERFVSLSQRWHSDTYTDLITSTCSVSSGNSIMYLNTALDLLYQFFDLELLVNNKDYHTDVELMLGGDIESIKAHKFVLCRAPFFKNMFRSGFSESETGIVEFDSMDRDALMAVIKFIYSDRIQLSPQICIGVLVYALMFDLTELQTYCRSIVCSMLNDGNVAQILEIADLYSDQILKRSCAAYIKNNYNNVTETSQYKALDPILQGAVEKLYVSTVLAKAKKIQLRENNKLLKKAHQLHHK